MKKKLLIMLFILTVMVAILFYWKNSQPQKNLIFSGGKVEFENAPNKKADYSQNSDIDLAQVRQKFINVSSEEQKLAEGRKLDLKTVEEDRVSPVKIELNSIWLALHQFKQQFGKYPTGNNEEIVRQLTGQNSKQIVFIILKKRSSNELNELFDPWGKAYLIEIDNDVITVLSAGPDGKFGKRDDLKVSKQDVEE